VKFRFIQAQRETFPVGQLCRVLEVSRSGFYSWSSRPQSERDQQNAALLQRIHAVHRENRGVYGSPRVYRALRAAGHRAGRHRVARLMRLEGLRGRAARRFRFIATRRSDFPAAPNLVLRNFRADGPNRLWVADITQIRTRQGWLFLAVLVDVFSRRVVGWATADRISHALTLQALPDRPTIPSARAGARSSQRSGLSVRWRRLPGASRPLRHPLQHEPLW
jgi:putative transposase